LFLDVSGSLDEEVCTNGKESIGNHPSRVVVVAFQNVKVMQIKYSCTLTGKLICRRLMML